MQQHLRMMSINMERQSTLSGASNREMGANEIVAAYTPVELHGHRGKFSIRCSYDTIIHAQGAFQFSWAQSIMEPTPLQ